MEFGWKKNNERNAKMAGVKRLPSCDVDLRSCEINLDGNVEADKKRENSTAMVGNLMVCDSPACSSQFFS